MTVKHRKSVHAATDYTYARCFPVSPFLRTKLKWSNSACDNNYEVCHRHYYWFGELKEKVVAFACWKPGR